MTPETPNDPTVQTLSLSRGQASYTDVGEGPVFVVIHGLPGSVRDYRWLGASLPTSIRMIRLDMPGFGGTDLSCEPGPGIGQRASFVVECLDALHIDSCVLAGHSMGGPVALEVAAQHPKRILGLALLASVGLRPHRAFRNMPNPRRVSRLLRIPGLPRLFQRPIRQGYQRAGFPSSIPYKDLVRSMIIVGAVDFTRIQDNQKKLTVPTFFSWAEDDRLIEKDVFEEHANASPDGPRLRFQEGGHNIQKSQAVELGEALTKWIHNL